MKIVPSMNNFQMDSGSWGYMTLTSTAIRVSNAYSRQSSYSPAFGVAEKGVSPALLTPNKYSNVSQKCSRAILMKSSLLSLR